MTTVTTQVATSNMHITTSHVCVQQPVTYGYMGHRLGQQVTGINKLHCVQEAMECNIIEARLIDKNPENKNQNHN